MTPKENTEIKTKFKELIEKGKKLNIEFNEDIRVISMDETPCYLDMNFLTTIDFTGNKNIETISSGREKYRILIKLSITGWY